MLMRGQGTQDTLSGEGTSGVEGILAPSPEWKREKLNRPLGQMEILKPFARGGCWFCESRPAMENEARDEIRSLILSARMEVPDYAADPIVQQRLGNILSDASRRLFARLNGRADLTHADLAPADAIARRQLN